MTTTDTLDLDAIEARLASHKAEFDLLGRVYFAGSVIDALVAEVRRLRAARPGRDELLAELRSYHAKGGDQEIQHVFADTALLRYINDPEMTAAFEVIEKWYA